MGEIVTFYSYKGGTGRTMALANLGHILAWRLGPPRRVLMIDWDLEAPGLHTFFFEQLKINFSYLDIEVYVSLLMVFRVNAPHGIAPKGHITGRVKIDRVFQRFAEERLPPRLSVAG